MRDPEFIVRLRRAFDNASMADVARRLDLPHATVRNYFKEGRLPAPEVLIRIARETGVSLNWLLLGTGEMYAGEMGPVGLGKFLEQKIADMIDKRLAHRERPSRQNVPAFDLRSALDRFGDPQRVMSEWLRFEGSEYPSDFGVVFFRGWESFTRDEQIDALTDAKRALDRVSRTAG